MTTMTTIRSEAKTWTRKENAAKDAKKTLGPDAFPGADFAFIELGEKAWTWTTVTGAANPDSIPMPLDPKKAGKAPKEEPEEQPEIDQAARDAVAGWEPEAEVNEEWEIPDEYLDDGESDEDPEVEVFNAFREKAANGRDGCRRGTNRSKLLSALVDNGRYETMVPVSQLMKDVYGADDAKGRGKLMMVMKGLQYLIDTRDLPFEIRRERDAEKKEMTYGLYHT